MAADLIPEEALSLLGRHWPAFVGQDHKPVPKNPRALGEGDVVVRQARIDGRPREPITRDPQSSAIGTVSVHQVVTGPRGDSGDALERDLETGAIG